MREETECLDLRNQIYCMDCMELMAHIPADTPLLTLSLTPLEGAQHMLCISTDALQDGVGNFCTYSEWHPAAPDGTAFSVCVLLGEREKSHKDWLPFG